MQKQYIKTDIMIGIAKIKWLNSSLIYTRAVKRRGEQ